jgi:hypothetical protein
MPHDVFISYASEDLHVAKAACAKLETRRIRCWFAPRDIIPGSEYAEAIVTGIEEARVFVVIFSGSANDSPNVRREVERAVTKGKIILPVRVEDVQPTKAMEFCLGNTHWLNAMTPPLEEHLENLADTIAKLLESNVRNVAAKSSATVLSSMQPESGEAGFEYRSEWEILGLPVLHIGVGLPKVNRKPRAVRGLIAIGEIPRGLVAIGSAPIGVLAMGAFPIGLVSVGFLSAGMFAVGALAGGLAGAYGVLAAGPVALGWASFGYYAYGQHPFGAWVWGPTMIAPEARQFFEPWVKPSLHGLLIALCLLSYLLPRCFRLLARMVRSSRIKSSP